MRVDEALGLRDWREEELGEGEAEGEREAEGEGEGVGDALEVREVEML